MTLLFLAHSVNIMNRGGVLWLGGFHTCLYHVWVWSLHVIPLPRELPLDILVSPQVVYGCMNGCVRVFAMALYDPGCTLYCPAEKLQVPHNPAE